MRLRPVLDRLFARQAKRPRTLPRQLRLGTLEDREVPALVINPTFAPNITSDPNAATIIATINAAIQAYEDSFSDSITVNITFQEGGGLGGSSTRLNTVSYSDYRAALVSHSTTADDTTALASVPTGSTSPVNSTSTQTGTITTGSNVVTGLSETRSLAVGQPVSGTGVPGGTTISFLPYGDNGNTTSGSNLITGLNNTTTLAVGLAVSGPGIPAGTTVASIAGPTSITVSNNATATATAVPLAFGTTNSILLSNNATATGAFTLTFQGNNNLLVRTANLRALGLPGGSVASDSTITLNTAICNLSRTGPQDPTKFDLMAVTAHEIDEALAYGSALNNLQNGDGHPATIEPDDLFRYDQTGARSYDTNLVTQSFFSIDGGVTDLARFNQTQGGDFSDWFSPGGQTPQVQDAFGTRGATANLGVELRRLDVLGYTRVATATPALTAAGNQTAVEGASKAFDLNSFADADDGPWGVTVNWGDSSANTSFFVGAAGSLGTQPHTYAEEGSYTVTVTVTDFTGLTDSKTFTVTVSDPAVVATGAAITAVEGQDTGPVAVATFTDPGGAEPVGDYSASIDWGDGSSSAGTISFAGGVFTVSGHHTYAEESAADHPGSNPYQITVTISHEAAPTATAHSTATVSDPAVIATGGFEFVAVEGDPSATQTVATFTDPGGAEILGDYSASIDWGDGTAPSVGTISLAGGVFTVTGSHTYATGLGTPGDFGNTFCDADPPSYHKPITVTISHEDAPDAVAVSDAKISLKPGSAHLASDGSLIVVGTPGDNLIGINPVGNQDRTVKVRLGTRALGSFTVGPAGRIVVAAMGGDDNIQVAGGVRVDAVLYGGPGSDRIKGGGGQSVLVGCEGNDVLTGGNQGDLLIGGEGADRLIGGHGADILVAGTLEDASNNEDDNYTDLVSVLSAGVIPAPLHAADDGATDWLNGASGSDTFYYHFLGGGVMDVLAGGSGLEINI